jgi:hypothetical protein
LILLLLSLSGEESSEAAAVAALTLGPEIDDFEPPDFDFFDAEL